MKREFLTELKLDEETIEKIMIEHGKTVNGVKQKLDEKTEESKLLSEKVVTLEKQNKDTATLLKDNEDLKKQYETLQSTSETSLKAKDKEINGIITKGLLKDELIEMGCINPYPDLLIKNINLEDVIVKDNKILNKETILKPLKDNFKDVFKEKQVSGQKPDQSNQNNQGNEGIKNPFSKDSWNLTEQAKLYNTDKQLYDRLKNTK
jgi:hypothetical protein